MARPTEPNQLKLGEKLIILNDRGVGMLTRIYNIKKACGDAKSKPAFLSDKTLESSIKTIVRKFPNIDIKGLQPVTNLRNEIIKALSLYYHTFVDLMDFRDRVCELLTTIDVHGVELNITLNFDLTQHYLDLVTTYVSLMILLSQVEDRKAVLGLFTAAHEIIHGQGDSNFPRLGQMISEYEVPLKKLSEEFVPHSKVLKNALISLLPIHTEKDLSKETLLADQTLCLVRSAGQMLKPAATDTMSCGILSLDRIEKWVILGFPLCHSFLSQEQPNKLWIAALESGWVITLFRDEVIHFHQYIQTFFESIKGYSKRVSEVKECFQQAVQKSVYKHRERRKILRYTVKELGLILTDQPGLLGPKALMVFMALSRSRDEVIWLLRHSCNPLNQGKNKGRGGEDLVDRQLPELLFHCEELRTLVKKYSQVFQRYYLQYLSGFDAPALQGIIQNLTFRPKDTMEILIDSQFTIANLRVGQITDNELFDFRALRLDWIRLQASMSVQNTQMNLTDHKELAYLMDSIVFHSQMMDNLDEMLIETSDLSIICFHSKKFDQQFHMCLEFPSQTRYAIVFPLICCHFENSTHELCPEERHHIRDKSISMVNVFLDTMAKEAKNLIASICEKQCEMSDILLPKHCAPLISQVSKRKKKDKNKKNIYEVSKPGIESYKKNREKLTPIDKLHGTVTELCYAIDYCQTIHLWDYKFAPRGYLHEHLEIEFCKALLKMIIFSTDINTTITKPTELLLSIKSYMDVLQTIESYVSIDITQVFNSALLQQTQELDNYGEKTIALLYSQWYADDLLKRVNAGNICYSSNQRAFITLSIEGPMPFHAEEFSDINELRALAEIIGPYGMKMLNENLMFQIADQIQQLEKLTTTNKDVLDVLRRNFNNPEIIKEQMKKLQHVDNLLQRVTGIGVILSFRELCHSALVDVLEERVPFLLSSILDFRHHLPLDDPTSIVSEMSSAAGIGCNIDPTLTSVLKSQKGEIDDNQQLVVYLLLIFVAVSIPKLAKNDQSFYKVSIGGYSNNIQCMATAINNIFGALFNICGKNDIKDKMKEFLALASSSLLRLGQECDKEATKNRDSIYLLLNQIVQESPFLTMDLLESCFPYALIRNAFHDVYKLGNC